MCVATDGPVLMLVWCVDSWDMIQTQQLLVSNQRHRQEDYIQLVKKIILRCRDGKKTETRIWYLYYPFLHSTTVRYNYVLQVHSIQWNAGMGNTDTLHPNSCFCSLSIPTSK